jgi:hypothetical protein
VLLLALWIITPIVHAAPSTELPQEFYTVLENSIGRFAIVDKATGQMRIGSVSAASTASFAAPFRSHQPDVTAITSGFLAAGTEQIALSSITSNRILFAPVNATPTTVFFPREPGPDGVALIRESNVTPHRLLLNSVYGPDALHSLEMTTGTNLGTPAFNDDVGNLPDVRSLQPHYLNAASRREGLSVWYTAGSPSLLTLYDNGGVISGLNVGSLPADTRLATNVRNIIGNFMAVGFVPGSKTLSLITINTGATPWQPVAPFPTFDLGFEVGSIAAATGLGGAPHGILITSNDGTQAAFGQINNTGTLVSILQNFTNTPSLVINGLLPVPGRGIIRLEGKPGNPSTSFIFDGWNGGSWATKDAGALPGVLPAQTEFASVLWYDAEPLVDPKAKLLQIDVEADWSNGGGTLPSPLTRETFVSSSNGLDNPVPIAITPPAAATHVLTNQLLADCSIAVLRPNSALLDPPLNVVPASGDYDQPVLVDADSIDTLYDIFYRENRAGVAWQEYGFAFGVGYPSTWLFYAKHKITGATGPIISRTYSFDPADYPDFDSDNDGVPDYVEQWANLDPNGGADSDGDLQSDMEEILDQNEPDDITDFEPAASRNPPFIGQGFLLIVEANDTSTGEASPGETIEVRNMSSAVLDDAIVEVLTSPAGLGGQLGAPITVNTPVSLRHWAVLNSPLYFDLGNVALPPRDGREVYKLLEIPDIPLPPINPILSGTDLEADASAWRTAAQAAYAAFEPVTAITDINPLDTAVAVLGEAALYDALLNLDPSVQTSLGVPQDIPADSIAGHSLFTLFGDRASDSERSNLSEAMIAALELDGLSFNNLLAILEAEVAAATDLQTLLTAIYDWHVLHSDSGDAANYMPGLPLPLEVLRGLTRGDDLPFETAPDPPGPPHWDYRAAATQALVDSAKTDLANALALLPSAYRPVADWTIEIGSPILPGETYGYTNISNLTPVVLVNDFGELFNLDQGLGLSQGARYSVHGYTDVTAPGGISGHDAIEPIAIVVLTIPLASDSDQNANLLDDQWEEFFFGNTGVVAPFETHPVSGFTYLTYHISGADPRDDSMDIPSIPNIPFPEPTLVLLPNNNLGLDFSFPHDHVDSYNFGVQDSDDLVMFDDLPGTTFSSLGGDNYQIDLGATATPTRRFFRLTMALN